MLADSVENVLEAFLCLEGHSIVLVWRKDAIQESDGSFDMD
jgi:hypothetical protein